MKWYYDKSVQKVRFKEGDLVMLDLKNWQKSSKKFTPKYNGPFKIIEQLSPVTFRLDWPANLPKIHPVFHASKLFPYKEPDFESQKFTNPPPIIIDEEEEYEVDKILKSRRTGRKKQLQYLIRWKGYGPNDDTWEPVENLPRALEVIQEFYKRHPKAQR